MDRDNNHIVLSGVLEDTTSAGTGLKGDITPQWVVRYMASFATRRSAMTIL